MRTALVLLFIAAAAFAAPGPSPKKSSGGLDPPLRWGNALRLDGRGGGAKWKVADGAIVSDEGEPGWLQSDSQFGDFVLRMGFRTRRPATVAFPGQRAGAGRTKPSYELQIWDQNEKFPTGSLVNVARGARRIKADDWNEYEIQAEGRVPRQAQRQAGVEGGTIRAAP
jgi:hypothetical protein